MPSAIVAMDNWILANFAVDEQQESDEITHCLNDWARFWIHLQRIFYFLNMLHPNERCLLFHSRPNDVCIDTWNLKGYGHFIAH